MIKNIHESQSLMISVYCSWLLLLLLLSIYIKYGNCGKNMWGSGGVHWLHLFTSWTDPVWQVLKWSACSRASTAFDWQLSPLISLTLWRLPAVKTPAPTITWSTRRSDEMQKIPRGVWLHWFWRRMEGPEGPHARRRTHRLLMSKDWCRESVVLVAFGDDGKSRWCCGTQ